MESNRVASPADARRALQDVEDSRSSIARRLCAPWWYRLGAATCAAALFVGPGLLITAGADYGSLGLLVTMTAAVLWPMALLAALKRATGISIDRYASGMATWYSLMFALFGVAFAVQVLTEVTFALHAAAAVAFVATWVNERRIDVRLRQRVQASATPA